MIENNVLVCGGSGLVGRTLIDNLLKNNIHSVGTYNKNKFNNLIYINFEDINMIEEKILEIKPNFCISSIAERQNEICENNWDEIKKINVDIAYNIALICKKHNIFLIHLSTDYVFDGLNPPFTPLSLTNPLQNYGISKLIAEKRILSIFNNDKNFLIIRVPVLYSNNIKNFSESAVSLITKKVINKIENVKEDNYSVRRPVFIDDLCAFIINCINEKKLSGIHCFYNPFDKITKYEIAKKCANILHKDISHISPLNEKPLYEKALRPIDTDLYDETIHQDILDKKIKITLLEDGLRLTLNKLIHPKINIKEINPNNANLFFLLDLDGTLVDSEIVQWKSYRDALKEFNIDYTFSKFTEICHNGDIKEYLHKNYNFTNEMYSIMKNNKKKHMLKYESDLKLIDGADFFIDYLDHNKINHVVVTNSSIDTVNMYKSAIPQLNKIKNWIKREDYIEAKPSPECYNLAIKLFYKKEAFIIGFENSLSGLESIKHVTDKIYFLTYKDYLFYDKVKNEDIFLIKNFNDI